MAVNDVDAPQLPIEAQLLLRVAAGDRAAFAELFQAVAPKIKGYLARLGSTPAAAEELTQDVMLTVWRKAGQFDPAKAGALTWIFVVARNRRIDSLRRERSTVTYGAEAPDEVDENVPLASDVIVGAQRDARVRAALETLSDDQREVVRRSFFEEEPHSAIAEALNLPLGTVKSRLRLAMAKLRASLGDLR
jgi:RNA polymerase sigma-70 factor, ECF subfamily